MTLLKDDGHELDIEKGVYVYWRKFGNRTRDDPSIFIEWEDLDNPEALIRLDDHLTAILERFSRLVLKTRMDIQTVTEEQRLETGCKCECESIPSIELKN